MKGLTVSQEAIFQGLSPYPKAGELTLRPLGKTARGNLATTENLDRLNQLLCQIYHFNFRFETEEMELSIYMFG